MSLDLAGFSPADTTEIRRRLEIVRSSRERARLAAEHGRTGVAPFLASPDVETVELVGGAGLSGYARRGRWAVTPGDVVAPEHWTEEALDEYLDVLRSRRLRPAFLAVADVEPLRRRGFDVTEIADEAVIDLASFSLAGSKRANIRHSTTSARRAGLVVRPFDERDAPQIEEISREWLRTKRGGEMGFTLSRYEEVSDQVHDHSADLWVTVDASDRVQAWCTWRHYLGGQGRVLDVMRRRPDAPNPAMDGLMATVLENYRDAGLSLASLASVPRGHGDLAERVYPTRSLRAYKQKFAPRWETRWLAVPAARQRLFALMAVGRAYCPGGLGRALRPNR
ncbi:MAG TPA: phosphatidylglycerol lysyltransferase domain-containing protein [Jatrophihabitans sp.]|jgi:phosphatidylglycerol lysyltransferase|uniref:phosphatidylglycerol lysyltransferase domain-containing protein n=1 Tax=Jatrophihabitans sp. TaxID=1932789 RepID=UPI002E096D19|nr:phosphatidylglycerol lysyltransferase domain-containing protein [Jatrophihabitans sp.]